MKARTAVILLALAGSAACGSSGQLATSSAPPTDQSTPQASISIDLPGLVGQQSTVAKEQLRQLGLQPWISPVRAGCVVRSQDPAPGTAVPRGSDVRLGVNCLAGAGAICGVITTPQGNAKVLIRFGQVYCDDAANAADRYFNDPSLASNNNGSVTFGQWNCAGMTADAAQSTGEYGDCYTNNATVRVEIMQD